MQELQTLLETEITPKSQNSRDFVGSFAKGLLVMRAFSDDRQGSTLSEIAERTGLDRAAARRFLLTLVAMGFAEQQGRQFVLTPKVLDLAMPYLQGQNWIERAQPLMKALSERVGESCSASVLDDDEIVYVARVAANRIMSVGLNIGSRLPAYCTSMGRVLLGGLDEAVLDDRLARSEIRKLTDRTLTDRNAIKERITQDRAQGFSIVDQELETGLTSLAVPIHCGKGPVIAALNISCNAGRVSLDELSSNYAPKLQETARQISALAI